MGTQPSTFKLPHTPLCPLLFVAQHFGVAPGQSPSLQHSWQCLTASSPNLQQPWFGPAVQSASTLHPQKHPAPVLLQVKAPLHPNAALPQVLPFFSAHLLGATEPSHFSQRASHGSSLPHLHLQVALSHLWLSPFKTAQELESPATTGVS
jgi:hypothetical protein